MDGCSLNYSFKFLPSNAGANLFTVPQPNGQKAEGTDADGTLPGVRRKKKHYCISGLIQPPPPTPENLSTPPRVHYVDVDDSGRA